VPQRARGCGRRALSRPGATRSSGWSGAASMFLRRARLVAPMLLQIRKKVRGCVWTRRDGREGLEGRGDVGNLGLMASRGSSPARSLRARTRWPGGALAKLDEGNHRGGCRG
jgi:hypothetical protein